MGCTREQWEASAIKRYGTLELARAAMSERGRNGGETTRDKGHLEKIGFQNLSRDKHIEAARKGGLARGRRSDEG